MDFKRGLNRDQVEVLEKDLKGLKVRYELPNGSKRGYRVNGVKDAANKLKIPELNITVAEYFKQNYKKSLEFPLMPCLWLGSREKTIFIPVELCSMTAQPLPRNKALQDEATAKMIRGTAVNPLDRQKRILAGLKANNDMFRDDPYAKEFGINVAGSMSKINGRILAPPALEYFQKKEVTINPARPGSWMQPKGMEYVEGKTLDTWAVMDLARLQDREYQDILGALTKVGRESGLKISSKPENMWKEVCDLAPCAPAPYVPAPCVPTLCAPAPCAPCAPYVAGVRAT